MKKFFNISKHEGLKYAKSSGDNNKIHINENYGYNSVYGENICHGTFVILNFLEIIKFKKKIFFSLQIIFKFPFFYNKKIFIKTTKQKKLIKYFLYQDLKIKAIITIKNNIDNKKNSIENISYKRVKIIKLNNLKYKKNNKNSLRVALDNLSKYVGTIYPGKNSLISGINIIYKKKNKNNFSKTIKIGSKLIKRGFPIIKNRLTYSGYIINFDTLIRPSINKKKFKFSSILKKNIIKIRENTLILGASQGIGKDVLNILRRNKKIYKIATYYKNIINLKEKKLITKKINIEKDTKLINRFIKLYSPIKIYYFPSKKIFFDNKLSKEIIEGYRKLYISIPLQILKENKKEKISFFYPSTLHINLNKNSIYSKIKLEAEQKIKKVCKKFKIPFVAHRFPAINSRQSVSLINPNPKNLAEYLGADKSLINSLF